MLKLTEGMNYRLRVARPYLITCGFSLQLRLLLQAIPHLLVQIIMPHRRCHRYATTRKVTDVSMKRALVALLGLFALEGQLQSACLSPANAQPAAQQSWFVRGEQALKDGNIDLAISNFRKSHQLFPEHLPTILALARVLKKAGKADESAAQYRHFLELEPDNVSAELEFADLLSWRKETRPEALRTLKQVISNNPHNMQARHQLAEIASWDSANRPIAEQELKSILALKPDDLLAELSLARVLSGGKKFDEAVSHYQRYLAIRPKDVKVNLELANLLAGRPGRLADARKLYQQVLTLEPGNKWAQQALLAGPPGTNAPKAPVTFEDWYTKAVHDFHKGYFDSAIVAFQRARALLPGRLSERVPDRLKVSLGLSDSYMKNGKADKAGPLYRQILELEPNNVKALSGLATVLSWDKKTAPEAIPLLEQLVQLQPDNQAARGLLAQLASSVQDKREVAITQLSYLLVHRSLSAKQCLLLARLLNWQKHYNEARDIYLKYLEQVPGDRTARLELASMLSYEPATRDEAVARFSALLSEKPDDTGAGLGRARTLTWMKKYQQAMADFSRYLPAQNASAEALRDYVMALKGAGNLELALTVATRLGDSPSTDARDRLALATILDDSGQAEKAEKILLNLKQSDLSNELAISTQREYAHSLALESRLSESLAEYQKLMDNHALPPELSAEIRLEEAGLLVKRHEWLQAENLASQALAITPKSIDAWALLIGSYLGDNKIDQANASLKRVPPESLDLPIMKKLAAETALKSKDFKTALHLYQGLYDHQLSTSGALSDLTVIEGLAQAHIGLSDYRAADEIYRTVLAQSPHSPELNIGLARVLVFENRMPEAEAIIKRSYPDLTDPMAVAHDLSGPPQLRPLAVTLCQLIVTANPDNTDALLLKAQVLSWSLLTRSEAISAFNSYLEKKPGDLTAMKQLADLLAWSGKRKDSLKLYAVLLANQPSDIGLINSQSQILSWVGHLGEAKRGYRSVLQRNSDDRRALIGLAECQNWSGDHFSSEKTFQKAAKLYPDDPELIVERAENFRQMGRIDKAKSVLSPLAPGHPQQM
jgi:tetratricopeptide (TPR) repeat protein